MSDAPDIHVCELGPRNDLQNLSEGRTAIRRPRRGRGDRAHAIRGAHTPAKRLTEAGIPTTLRRFA
jgi:hypothetical protein